MWSVLLVDDNETVLDALARTLELRLPKLKAHTCPSAQVAFQRFSVEPYNVIISDVWMPGLDGLALLREVKRVRPSLPVILMSGTVDAELVTQALEAGAYEVLAKPIVREDFVDVVRSALEWQRLISRIDTEWRTHTRLARQLHNLAQRSRERSNRSVILFASALQRLAGRVALAEYGLHLGTERLLRAKHEAQRRTWERLHSPSTSRLDMERKAPALVSKPGAGYVET